MDAVGSVDLQMRLAVFLHDFIHTGGAVARFGRGEAAVTHLDGGLFAGKLQMRRLVFFVVGVGQIHTAGAVERHLAVRFGVFNWAARSGRFQALAVATVVANSPRRTAAEQIHIQRVEPHGRPETPFEGGADIAGTIELVVQPGLAEGFSIGYGFGDLFRHTALQHAKHGFGGQHGRFHGGMRAFDAGHIEETRRIAHQHAAGESELGQALQAALGECACAIGNAPPAFKHGADGGMGFKPLKLFKRREIGVLIVQPHHEADGHFIISQMVEERATVGAGIQRPAHSVHHVAGLRLFGPHFPNFLHTQAVGLRLAVLV